MMKWTAPADGTRFTALLALAFALPLSGISTAAAETLESLAAGPWPAPAFSARRAGLA